MKISQIVLSIIAIVGFIILSLAIRDGVFLKAQYNIEHDKYDIEKGHMSKSQFQLIQAGIKSASSHNMQPWKIRIIDPNTFTLFADKSKTLEVVDPEYKQMLVSQGTFIGAVKAAAKLSGIKIEVIYHSVNMEDETPEIATFKIVEGQNDTVDVLSSATNASKTGSKLNDISNIKKDAQNIPLEYKTVWIEGEKVEPFQTYLRKGVQIESENKSAMEELLRNFRFTKWAKNKYRYGLSLNQIPPVPRMVIEPLIELTSGWKSFGQSSIQTFEKRLDKETMYLLLAKKNPTPSDYIQVGEIISNLSQSFKDYSIRPEVQLLEPLEGMDEPRHNLMNDYQMNGEILIILGFTEKYDTYHETIRHKVMDLIIS